jgi:hypothetical protein
MKAVFYHVDAGVEGRLLACNISARGKTLGEATDNLQILMAGRVVSCHVDAEEHVWPDNPAEQGYWDRWNDGEAVFYTKHSFVFDGKIVEIPNLSVRVWEPHMSEIA